MNCNYKVNMIDIQTKYKFKIFATRGEKGEQGDVSLEQLNEVKNQLQNEINSLSNGSPLVASSTSGMTDTTKVYVNTSDGYWYYYNGSNWAQGGVYQSTGIANNGVYLYNLDKSVTGLKYHFVTEESLKTPEIKFNFLKDFDMGNLSSLGLKGKFTNNMDIMLGVGTFAIVLRKPTASWGQAFSFTGQFPGDVNPGETLNIDQTKSFSSTYSGIKPTGIALRLAMATSRLYEFTIEDLEFYINGEKLIYGKDYTFDTTPTTQEDLTPNMSYLASKKYVDSKINDVNNSIEEQLEILMNYDSATKSNLKKVSCWGDSLTAGAYPTYLQELLGNSVVVTNNGRSGEASGEIAFREGGVKLYTAENITIPASATATPAFNVTVSNGYRSSLARFNETVFISGIEGNLQLTSSGFVFTRTNSGSETVVASGTEITCPSQTQYLDNVSIIWVGRNDVAFNSNVLSSLVPTVQGMIDALTTDIKRFLVISPTTATDEYEGGQYEEQYNKVIAMENLLKTAYPKNYVDIEDYLVHQCIYDMEITPTSDDLLNISRGTIPPSLMTDTIHPKTATREYIARYIYNEMLKRDWIR